MKEESFEKEKLGEKVHWRQVFEIFVLSFFSSLILFFFFNKRESIFVPTDSDEHLIVAKFFLEKLSFSGRLGESGSFFVPFTYSRIGFSIFVSFFLFISRLFFPNYSQSDQMIFTSISSTFFSLFLLSFSFFLFARKKEIKKEFFPILFLLFCFSIYFLDAVAFVSNLFSASLVFFFLLAEKRFLKSLFSFLSIVTRFETSVFIFLSVLFFKKGKKVREIIEFCLPGVFFILLLGFKYSNLSIYVRFGIERVLFFIPLASFLFFVFALEMKKLNNPDLSFLFLSISSFVFYFKNFLLDKRYSIFSVILFCFFLVKFIQERFEKKKNKNLDMFLSLFQLLGIFSISIASFLSFRKYGFKFRFQEFFSGFLRESPYSLMKKMENCGFESKKEAIVFALPYGETFHIFSGFNAIALKNYPTVKDKRIECDSLKKYFLVENESLYFHVKKEAIEKILDKKSPICKFSDFSIQSWRNSEKFLVTETSIYKITCDEVKSLSWNIKV